jgi:RNA polymerase sigma-70 factor (ECF subfamily)
MNHFRANVELTIQWGFSWRVPDLLRRGDLIQPKAQSTRPVSPRLRLVPGRGSRADEGRPTKDTDLVQALRAGEPDAPAALWARYSPSVGRVLAKALGPTVEIEDLTQEVFLRVFGRLPSLRDPSALRAFVLGVAMNVLKWELRRRWIGRRVRLSGTGELPDVACTPADAEARHALQHCYRILDSLPTKERMAFVLRCMEGMTIEEAAEALGVSISTAKRWVSRGAAKVAAQVTSDADLCSFFAGNRKESSHER